MIKQTTIYLALVAGVLALGNFTARANTYVMQFTADDFLNLNGSSVAAPTDPLTGIIVYEAAGLNDPIQSFDTVSLTIDGHSYTPGELSFFLNTTSTPNPMGILNGGPSLLQSHTDDFSMVWNWQTMTPVSFLYTSSQTFGIFSSTTFTASTLAPVAPVPEPSVAAMFFLSGGVVLLMRNRLAHKRGV